MERIFQRVALALGLLVGAAPATRAAYLDAESWFSAVPPGLVQTFQVSSFVAEDAFGTWSNEFEGAGTYCDTRPQYSMYCAPRIAQPTTAEAGQWKGNFGCHTIVYPCVGAYRITYKLPYRIIGIAGDLDYWYGYNRPTIDFFDNTTLWAMPETWVPRGYSGFYGTFFAPTDTITVTWTDGLRSTDSYTGFLFSNAVMVRAGAVQAVPEPTALALFGVGLLGLIGLGRRQMLPDWLSLRREARKSTPKPA